MTGASWIAEKINAPDAFKGVTAIAEADDIVFVQRSDKPSAHIGVVPTSRGETAPLVNLKEVKAICSKKSLAMLIAIPRGARWSGAAMQWLESEGVAFGGVGDLLSAISHDEDMSAHRNKTLAFVNDGLLKHSRVSSLEWVDSKKVDVQLKNGTTIVVALDDAYDITMSVAREAARTLGKFDILLKTNPNGSITSDGAKDIEQLGFQTLKWGELFGYLAKRGGQSSFDNLRKRLRDT